MTRERGGPAVSRVFANGTDTDVGKTRVGTALACLLAGRGRRTEARCR
jgi:dethiobiotin synthetase